MTAVALRPAQLFLLVFLPFAAGYFLSFLFRSINAVIAADLTRDLGLDASSLGLLTAAFFIAFASIQLPLGVVLDRYGAARVQSLLLTIAALGSLIFALADDILTLSFGRALIGLGCAGGLMAAFKAIMRWFPAERLALVNGCFLSIGGLGAMSATQPIELMLTFTDWRGVFLILAGLSLASAVSIFLFVPRGDASESPSALAVQVREVGGILTDALFWRFAPISVFGMGVTMSIQGLWAGPWLLDVAALPREDVANRLLAMAGAMAFGFIGTGYLSDFLRVRGVSSIHLMAAGTVLTILTLVAILLQVDPTGWWHWILFGAVGNVTALVYPALARHFGRDAAGRANTANTMLVFAGTFAIQYLIGAIIDFWPRDETGAYPAIAYQTAFAATIACQIASLIWLFRPGPDLKSALRQL
ncbi:MAG: MFS transporter [Pseudomonadota bacterium]|nr:MFS transporter [Pseudomonadota bacterium]